jgi:hypothetical protein
MGKSRTPGLSRVARPIMVAIERLCVVCVLYVVIERFRIAVDSASVPKWSWNGVEGVEWLL